MRTIVILAVLVVMAAGLVGCGGTRDAHQLYTERMSRLSWQADSRSIVDDVHVNILMDERPSHLSFYYQE